MAGPGWSGDEGVSRMQKRWLIGGVAGALAGLLGGAGAAGIPVPAAVPSAGAATAYTVGAAGTGLKLAVGGTTLVAGTAKVAANATGVRAEGIGEVTPGAVADEKASVAAPGGSQTANRTCTQPSDPFPAPLGSLVALGLACGGASAAESSSSAPTATATGQIATVALGSPASLATPKVLPGSTLATKLKGVLGTLPAIPSTGLPLSTVLDQVAHTVTSGGSVSALLEATVGTATSTVTTSSTTATATAKATGIRLALLDGLGGGGGPLLTVKVGQASAQSTVDLVQGTVTSADTPAVVTVTLDPPAGSPQSFSVAPGVSQTFLAGTPLATTVAAGGGATAGNGTTHGTASATGVTVDALQGVGAGTTGANGGLDLRIASVTSAATGTVPVAQPVAAAASSTVPPPPAPAAPVVTGATTVHTGEPWAGPLPFALLLLSLLTGVGLVTRRRLVPLVHTVGRAAGRVRWPAMVSHLAAGPGRRGLLRSPSGPGTGPAAPSPPGSHRGPDEGPQRDPDGGSPDAPHWPLPGPAGGGPAADRDV